jgi:hypothetical protein
MTDYSMLAYGLEIVGFSLKRQSRVKHKTNIKRWKAFFGVGPPTIRALYYDLEATYSSLNFRDLLLCLNWFKCYDTEHVLAGRWGLNEDTIRYKVKDYAKKIQSLKKYKIVFGGFDPEEIYLVTVDGVNFSTQEFRLDPR